MKFDKKINFRFSKIDITKFSSKIDKPSINYMEKFLHIKNLLRKYDYDVNKVVGVEKGEKEIAYVLYADKKLLRIYRGDLKSTALISGYLHIENAIPLNLLISKSIIDKLNEEELKEYIETEVYENGGLKEEEEYEIRFSLVESDEDEDKYNVEVIIIPTNSIKKEFEELKEEIGYIDYISFPAFSYKSLYEAEILKPANDLFIVILDDKIFLTYYSNGELKKISTINDGLNKIYEKLAEELRIKNFDQNLFYKILDKKGLNSSKYLSNEIEVFNFLKKAFLSQINAIRLEDDLERIFITTKYGNIDGLETIVSEQVKDIDVFDFQFYEDYNLDKLPIDPFLFLSMLEAHIAYKNNNQVYNFSPYLRPTTFFYRPSGQMTLIFILTLLFSSAYPLYLFIQYKIYENKNIYLAKERNSLLRKKGVLNAKYVNFQKQNSKLLSHKKNLQKEVNKIRKFIDEVYNFKYSYIPVSKTLFDITKILNKDNVLLENLQYQNGLYILDVKSKYDFQIPNFVYDLSKNSFRVYTDKIEVVNGYYKSTIKVIE